MININIIKEAIKEINLGASFFHLAPKAFYDKELETVTLLSNTDYYEYYQLMYANDDSYIESKVHLVLSDNERYLPITEYISNIDIAILYSDLYKDAELSESIEYGFPKFKMMLINKGLLDDFFEFKEKYMLTRAICFCNEHNIEYNI